MDEEVAHLHPLLRPLSLRCPPLSGLRALLPQTDGSIGTAARSSGLHSLLRVQGVDSSSSFLSAAPTAPAPPARDTLGAGDDAPTHRSVLARLCAAPPISRSAARRLLGVVQWWITAMEINPSW